MGPEAERSYCALCGCPFHWDVLTWREEHEWGYDTRVYPGYRQDILPPESVKWLSDITVMILGPNTLPALYTYSRKATDGSGVLSAPAQFCDVNMYPGEKDFFTQFGHFRLQGVFQVTDSSVYMIAIHDDCKKIMDTVMADRRTNGECGPCNEREFMEACRLAQIQNREASWRELEERIYSGKCDEAYTKPLAIRWGNAYEGAEYFWGGHSKSSKTSWGDSLSHNKQWISEEGYEWMCSRPLRSTAIPFYHMERFILRLGDRGLNGNKLNEDHIKKSCSRSQRPRTSKLSRLETIPAVALEIVASYLPLASFTKLRRCSTALYEALEMSSGFWLKQLVFNRAVPWLTELDDPEVRASLLKNAKIGNDWFGTIKALTVDGDMGLDMPIGIRNRRRIWRLARWIGTGAK